MRRVRAEGARISQIREMERTLGPDVGRSMRLGTELVIRHREVGRHFGVLARGARTQLLQSHVSLLCGQIKPSNSDILLRCMSFSLHKAKNLENKRENGVKPAD
jgi:hypothetical protein